MSGRLTPPSVQDGPLGWEPNARSNFAEDGARQGSKLDAEAAKRIGMEAYESSTSWLNSGRRVRWNENLRMFQSLHPSGSKYLSPDYRTRSQFFRPKSRAMVRRDEAATAAAFFSNEDVVSIQAVDDDDPTQQAGAKTLQALLQFRLTKTIPWFQTIVGARQDCEVMGICVGKAYWRYEEKLVGSTMRPRLQPDGHPATDEQGNLIYDDIDLIQKLKDHPWVDLLAPENFRFEPGCDWRNVVESSPYLIELEPVYYQEALERMEGQHGSEPEWLPVSPGALQAATDLQDDVTRRARESGRVPGKDADIAKPTDFSVCWTRANIVRYGGEDWWYRTLNGSGELLTKPRPLKEVHLHGERPYVVGSVVLETHKTYPSAKVELTRDLQMAANEDWNSRFDAIRFNLMPRQLVRAGAGLDPGDLLRFTPGKLVMVPGKPGEPLANDVAWDRPPPPGPEAYAEQDRINLDFDELTGAFTNSSVQASQVNQQSATGMHLMSGEASGMGEYELRLFAETFVEPLIRLLIKLEQAYETDPIVLSQAGSKAQLFQKFGISQINDELLDQEVFVRANVGIGATNPNMKLRNFLMGADALGKMFGPALVQGVNFEEVCSEVFGLLGYKDGARFFQPGFDPRVAQLQQQLAQAQKGQKAGPASDPTRVQAAETQGRYRLQEQQLKSHTDIRTAEIDAQAKKYSEDQENERTMLNAIREFLTDHHDRQAQMAGQQMQRMEQSMPMPQQPQQSGPPAHMLREGHITSFANGQKWRLHRGKPAQVTA